MLYDMVSRGAQKNASDIQPVAVYMKMLIVNDIDTMCLT